MRGSMSMGFERRDCFPPTSLESISYNFKNKIIHICTCIYNMCVVYSLIKYIIYFWIVDTSFYMQTPSQGKLSSLSLLWRTYQLCRKSTDRMRKADKVEGETKAGRLAVCGLLLFPVTFEWDQEMEFWMMSDSAPKQTGTSLIPRFKMY